MCHDKGHTSATICEIVRILKCFSPFVSSRSRHHSSFPIPMLLGPATRILTVHAIRIESQNS